MRFSGVFNNGKLAGSGKKAESLGAMRCGGVFSNGKLAGSGKKAESFGAYGSRVLTIKILPVRENDRCPLRERNRGNASCVYGCGRMKALPPLAPADGERFCCPRGHFAAASRYDRYYTGWSLGAQRRKKAGFGLFRPPGTVWAKLLSRSYRGMPVWRGECPSFFSKTHTGMRMPWLPGSRGVPRFFSCA